MYGHTVGAAIGMGYVSTPLEMPRADVLDASYELRVNGDRIPATASFRPFYDPASERPKS